MSRNGYLFKTHMAKDFSQGDPGAARSQNKTHLIVTNTYAPREKSWQTTVESAKPSSRGKTMEETEERRVERDRTELAGREACLGSVGLDPSQSPFGLVPCPHPWSVKLCLRDACI